MVRKSTKMNQCLEVESVGKNDQRFLKLTADKLDALRAFKLLIQKNSDTACIKTDVYSALLTAGNHSFTEVTRC